MSLSEADTKAKLIDPLLHEKGWQEEWIRREVPVYYWTGASHCLLNDNFKQQDQLVGWADYKLLLDIHEDLQPKIFAVIEAKKEGADLRNALRQAMKYAFEANSPFVYCTNGHEFLEFNRFEPGKPRLQSLSQFPTREELRGRYEAYMGIGLSSLNQYRECLDKQSDLFNELQKGLISESPQVLIERCNLPISEIEKTLKEAIYQIQKIKELRAKQIKLHNQIPQSILLSKILDRHTISNLERLLR